MIKVYEPEIVIPEPYKAAHVESSCHKTTIMESKWVGCFYCLTVYPPSKINNWITEPTDELGHEREKTAICPFCGIDSVVPMTPERFDSDFLEKMEEVWFRS